jgi:hypothetical protein
LVASKYPVAFYIGDVYTPISQKKRAALGRDKKISRPEKNI